VTDRLTVLAVVMFIGIATLVGMGGLIWLVGTTDVQDAATLAVIAGPTGTALGILGTLLVSTRTVPAEPTPVTVVDEPVEVTETSAEPAPRKR
jgi:hypothetical protein